MFEDVTEPSKPTGKILWLAVPLLIILVLAGGLAVSMLSDTDYPKYSNETFDIELVEQDWLEIPAGSTTTDVNGQHATLSEDFASLHIVLHVTNRSSTPSKILPYFYISSTSEPQIAYLLPTEQEGGKPIPLVDFAPNETKELQLLSVAMPAREYRKAEPLHLTDSGSEAVWFDLPPIPTERF